MEMPPGEEMENEFLGAGDSDPFGSGRAFGQAVCARCLCCCGLVLSAVHPSWFPKFFV